MFGSAGIHCMKAWMQKPVVHSKKRRSIGQAATSDVKFQGPKINAYIIQRDSSSKKRLKFH